MTSDPVTAGEQDTAGGGAPLVRLFAIVLSSSIGFFVIVPLLPLYLAHVSSGRDAAVWAGPIVASSFITQAVFSPMWGSMSDRYGARRMMLRAGVGVVIAQIMLVFCDTPLEILLVRAAHGCFAGVVPAAMTYTVRMAGASGKSLSSLSAARSAGAVLGPALGALLVAPFGFAVAFLAATGLLTVAIAAALTIPKDRSDPDAQARQSFLAKTKDLRRSRGLRGALATALSVAVVAGAMGVAVPLSLEQRHGLSPSGQATWLGVILAVGGVGSALAAVPWGKAADRFGWQRLLPSVIVGSGVAVALLAVSNSPLWLLFAFFAYSVIACEIGTLSNLYALAVTPAERHGLLMGLSNTVSQLGFGIGPLLAGLVASLSSAAVVYVVASVGLLLLCGGLWRGHGAWPQAIPIGS